MVRRAALRLAIMIVCGTLAASGCATVERGLTGIDRAFERASNATSYASWQHFAFSVKVSAERALYWQVMASQKDVETAARQGGWWGEDVPVASGPVASGQ